MSPSELQNFPNFIKSKRLLFLNILQDFSYDFSGVNITESHTFCRSSHRAVRRLKMKWIDNAKSDLRALRSKKWRTIPDKTAPNRRNFPIKARLIDGWSILGQNTLTSSFFKMNFYKFLVVITSHYFLSNFNSNKKYLNNAYVSMLNTNIMVRKHLNFRPQFTKEPKILNDFIQNISLKGINVLSTH